MVFLIEKFFGKAPKLGLCCRKERKFGAFDTFVRELDEFHTLFPQLRFEYLIV